MAPNGVKKTFFQSSDQITVIATRQKKFLNYYEGRFLATVSNDEFLPDRSHFLKSHLDQCLKLFVHSIKTFWYIER